MRRINIEDSLNTTGWDVICVHELTTLSTLLDRIKWCEDHPSTGIFFVDGSEFLKTTFYFENPKDALLFRLWVK